MPENINTLVADADTDSIVHIKELCQSVKGMEIKGVARSEAMLMAKIKRPEFDLLILDVNMGKAGSVIIDTIKQINPFIEIIVVYDPDQSDSLALVDALEKGVLECFPKPGDPLLRQYKEFRLQLLTIIGLLKSRKHRYGREKAAYKTKFFIPPKSPAKIAIPVLPVTKIDVVVIAASTGGPEIVSRIFSLLPGSFRVPILLVQHMPATMSDFFVKRLNMKSELEVIHAKEGDQIFPSKIFVAPGGSHMVVTKKDVHNRRFIRLNKQPQVNGVRPSADVLFKSVAQSYEGNILSVILTGMGKDGKEGVRVMKKKGCICLSQKAETCAVYGMPKAVDEADLTDESLDPLSLTQKIVMAVK
ncbi:MAG: hypothetical protein GY729_09150 [Desulfobacteraceae bacterium]|nr:hypothetical protein [Desulfobacteraceae bacterium]